MGPAGFAMSYFESLGCQMSYASNPADWMLDLITATAVDADEEEGDVSRDIDFPAEYEKSEMASVIKDEFSRYHPSQEERDVMTRLGEMDKYAIGYLRQSVILFLRNTISNIRNPSSA